MKNGVLSCVDVIRSAEKNRIMAVCKCDVCESITEVRPERLLGSGKYVPQSCSNCVNDLHKQRNFERYQKLYDCEGLEYQQKIHDSSRLSSIIGNAKCRGLNFELSEQQAITMLHSNCYYCDKPNADGIDRIDSTKNYTVDNCVPCCGICNRMKNKYDLDTFLE